MYKVYLEIGHEAAIRTKRTPEGFTHDWEVFVRGVEKADIQYFVEKVVFHLHETFPKPKRVVKEPPYSVKETGYAGFTLPIEIYLRNRDEPKKIQFQYDLHLQQTGPSIYKIQKEKFVFASPNDEFRHKLIKGGAMLVNSNTSIENTRDSHQSEEKTQLLSKPKLSVGLDTIKKHKSRQDEVKVPNSFQDLFGPPITKSSKVSPEPKLLMKDVQKSNTVKTEKTSEKVKSKHSPHKDRDKEKGKEKDPEKKNKEEKKSKDRSKERERSKEKKKDRSLSPKRSPKHSPKRIAPSPKRPPSPPPVKYKVEEKHSETIGKEKKSDAAKIEKKAKKEKREKERKEHKTHKEKDPNRAEQKQMKEKIKEPEQLKGKERSIKSPERVREVPEKEPKTKSEEKQKHKHKKKDKEKKEKRQENSHKSEKKSEKLSVSNSKPETKPEKETFKDSNDRSNLFGSIKTDPFVNPPREKPMNPLNTLLKEIKDQDDSSNSSISSLDDSSSEVKPKEPPPPPPPPVVEKKPPPVKHEVAAVEKVKEKADKPKKNKEKRSEKDPERKRKRKSENKPVKEEEPLEKVSREVNSDSEQPVKESTPIFEKNNQDYMSILKDLQQKIMTLQDNAELQRVVQLIAETGQFEVTTRTFDFDLCRLDRNTVQRLQDFFAPT